MKLLELDLHAYGPFSGVRLDLSEGGEGLHVIYGPNEAGKSSALRALHALFYGVPERTTDDFVHDKQKLRVGGRIRGADGNELVVYRRKGRKNTLLANADGELLDDNTMSRLLVGVDEPLFETLFGINHAALVRGGETLLLEHGREAEALFGSGLGSTAVHSLLQTFEDRAKGLFAPQASKPQINQLLKGLKDVQGRQREISLSARQWDEARKAVDRAKDNLTDIEQCMAEESKRRSFLERARRTLPNLAKRAEYLKRLAELVAIPELPDNFAEDCQEALDTRSRAVEDRRKAKTRIEALEEQIKKIDYSQDLIEKTDEIDDLRERLGSYRKANSDLPKLTTRHADRRKSAAESLKIIRPDLNVNDVSDLRTALGKRRRMTELSSQKDGLAAAVKSAHKALDKANADLKLSEKGLANMDETLDPAGLRAVVERGRALGAIDEDIKVEKARINDDFRKVQSQLDALGLWTGSLNEIQSAPLPSLDSIQVRAATAMEIKVARDSASKDRMSATNEVKHAGEILRKLELAGDVPTEAELQEVRSRRDEVWQLLRKKWLEGVEIAAESEAFGGVAKLPYEFESCIEASDETADRLRREAQRVHEDAAARARQESCLAVIEEIDSTLAELAEREDQASEEWLKLWEEVDITPRTPSEMSAWLSDVLRIRERTDEIDDRNVQLEARVTRRDETVQELVEKLIAVGVAAEQLKNDRLRPVLTEAENRLSAIDADNQRQQQLNDLCAELGRKITELDRDVADAKQNFDSWQEQWHKGLTLFGLEKDSTAAEVLDYMDACDSIVSLADEVVVLDQRIQAINADNQRFDSEGQKLLGHLATDLSELSPAEAISRLATRLTEHRTAATRLKGFSEQLDTACGDLSEANATIAASSESFKSLCRLASCKEPEELLTVSRQAVARDSLVEAVKEVEAELLEGGDGLNIEQLEKEVVNIDRDQLASQIEQVSQRIDNELQPEQRRLIELRTEAVRSFSDMTGEDDAAQLADEAQQIMSEVRMLAGQYVRTKIAGRVLRDQIERFRQEHRSPILAKASHYFSRLTCEAYTEIATTLDESDLPVLVGVRSDGERKRVEAMSDGTRDQLYLALRLATLEHYADTSEPLPFIVDDVLIQFDDKRSAGTLDTLAEFSCRTQVILFTHHLHVVEQAKKVEMQGSGVFIHELSHED